MKKISTFNTARISLSSAIILLLFFTGCSSKYVFDKSSIVPSAEGKVKVSEDGNANYKIDLDVMRLVEPERLTPSKKYYIVWMETQNSSAKNIGNLDTSSGMFSKTLKSSLETVTPFKPEGFFITAEDELAVQYPGSVVVLRTNK